MTTVERRPNKLALLVVAVALVAGGIAWVASRSSDDQQTVPSTTVAASSSTTTRAPASTTPTTATSTTVAPVVLSLALPSAAGVVLFAHTADPNAIVRVEIDRGRVVTTPIGSVLSTAPAFLAVGPSVAVVRPYDNVAGYVVADSGTVSAPPGLLDDGAFMACSDGRRDRLWLAGDSLLQVDYSGSLKAEISNREQRPSAFGCDGAGEMLYRSGTSTFVTGDGPPTLVTSNTVVAAGPRTFLVNDCAATVACALTVIDRPTGERRSLTLDASAAIPQRLPTAGQGRVGSISPDGRTAALFRTTREAVFVDLVPGIGQGVSSILGEFQSFAWSTDSRYLFYIGGGYQLHVFDRETRGLVPIGVNNVRALASRPS
ncbi:MAG: hypothetical protein ABIQ73_03210 [Acidimicrobiales bacterium]